MLTDINIRIIATMHDVHLLKRILKLYLPVASKREQDDIEAYLSLIDYAVKKAKQQEDKQ